MFTGITNWLLIVFGSCCVGGLVAYAYYASPPEIKLQFSVPEDTIYIMDSERKVIAKGSVSKRDE